MKRVVRYAIAILSLVMPVCAEPAAPTVPPAAQLAELVEEAKPLPGVELAEAVSATTGLAISPLFGMSVVGAWQWWHTPAESRAVVPWHAHPAFWIPALILVGLLVLKEPLLYFLPGAKKPFDLIEVVENKVSALLAAPLVVHLAMRTFDHAASGGPGVVLAGFGMGGNAAVVFGSIGLLAIFAVVWLVSHAINMLILFSPSATLDMALRGLRGLVLAVVVGSALLSPWIGLIVALGLVYFCLRCFGWAWRLLVMGSATGLDLISGRKQSGIDKHGRVRAYLVRADIPAGLPRRSRGWLHLDATGALVFTGRAMPWQASKTLVFDARDAQIVRGFLLGPDLRLAGEGMMPLVVASLPPRYTGAEAMVAEQFGIGACTAHPVARTWQAAMSWLKGVVGNSAASRQLER